MWLSSRFTRWLQTSSLPSVQATPEAQTEGSVAQLPTQPAASSQATAAVQTVSQAEQDLISAHQGRLPVSKDVYDMCKVIARSVQRATAKARDGHITAAEQDVFEVRH